MRVTTPYGVGSRVRDDEIARRYSGIACETVEGDIRTLFEQARDGLLNEVLLQSRIVDAGGYHATDQSGDLPWPLRAALQGRARSQDSPIHICR